MKAIQDILGLRCKVQSYFLGFVFIPAAAGYFLGGIPFFWSHPQHRYMLWITAFVNLLVVPFLLVIARTRTTESRIITVVSTVAFALGAAGAVWLQFLGKDVI